MTACRLNGVRCNMGTTTALAKNRAICDGDHSEGKAQRLHHDQLHDGKGKTMIKIILSVVAALFVTVGALTITGAGDDKSSAPTMTTLPVQY